ncbi:AlkA N-terminal domain-containing protein [Patulibacter medicamentivorans]|uniref:AlkA N-terminal domain-containing protein n=1 Tax=Patulibacter medicamentivorans TaxID=1097667 RepID=UPI0002F39733|nr:AlkA N-terminal domain-containing protein [Patulibacter medicamentivorans]
MHGVATIDDQDFEQRYAAVHSRDRRFDGRFVTAVSTTGIYCRPSCPAVTPRRVNVSFYPTAAAAQQAGFRACLRCRPEASPGSPEWDVRADVAGRAMRLIGDGVVDREGVGGLAARLGYSERHLNRLLVDELGAGPLALARSQRARTAGLLIESTAMPFTDIAFASGFGSLRQFNDTIRDVFGRTPTELRRRAGAGDALPGTVTVRLGRREPFAWDALLGFFERRAVPGLERRHGDVLERTLALPRGPGVCALRDDGAAVLCTLRLADLRDLAAAVARCRRLLDLDADPVAVDGHLAADPVLAPLVAATPGRRLPQTVDGFELALRTVVGQQVSVAGARTIVGRLVAEHGVAVGELAAGDDAASRLFPAPAVIAELPDERLPMPRARARAVRALAAAVAGGDLDLDGGDERERVREQLLALPGIGPWTVDYVAARALGDPDSIPLTDLGIVQGAAALAMPADPRALAARAASWSPWRAYAAQHVWSAAPEPRRASRGKAA